MKKIVKNLKDIFLDSVFPIECLGCSNNFEDFPTKDRWICPSCRERIEIRSEQVCPVCEKASDGGRVHEFCKDKTFLDGLWASVYYDDLVEKAVHRFKFDFVEELSFVLSDLMICSVKNYREFGDFHNVLMSEMGKREEENVYLNRNVREDKTFIIPVPLHKKRYNWRGFNQSELLAKNIAKRFSANFNSEILIREKNTKPQSGLTNEEERRLNISKAFCCNSSFDIKNCDVIIVDDVCTTLSTLNECARELKKSGAKNVWGFVLARR